MKTKQQNCPFCNIDEIKSKVTTTAKGTVMIFEPLNPVVEGHLLVVHKDHTKDFTDNPLITAKLVKIAGKIAKKKGGDYNLITSKGENATQTVNHLHIHLVPRKRGDGLLLPWSKQTK